MIFSNGRSWFDDAAIDQNNYVADSKAGKTNFDAGDQGLIVYYIDRALALSCLKRLYRIHKFQSVFVDRMDFSVCFLVLGEL